MASALAAWPYTMIPTTNQTKYTKAGPIDWKLDLLSNNKTYPLCICDKCGIWEPSPAHILMLKRLP